MIKKLIKCFILGLFFSAGTAASTVVPEAGADTTPPAINVWYGNNQIFGQIGIPQVCADILGNVSDASGIASLTYSLNSGPQKPLSLGPNGTRLQAPGDFVIDIAYEDFNCGANTAVIRATDNSGNTTSRTVNIQYSCGHFWPQAYSIDWSTVTNIQDVAQIVDGLWVLESNSVRPVLQGYDRLIAVGDIDPLWDDYEIMAPVTIHNLDSTVPWGPFVGFLLRWQGHYDWDGSQPKDGWWPMGGLGGYDWVPAGTGGDYKLHIIGNNGYTIAIDNSGRHLGVGVPYIFKMRVETSGTNSIYSLKVWKQSSPEPAGWDISGQGPAGELKYGSVMLVSHYTDVSFGNVTVTPGPFGSDTTPPVISNIQAAASATTATITWTTNEAATSRVQYGITTAYGSAVEDTTRTTFHSITLTSLAPLTTYHYKVTSADGSSNSTSSTDTTFTTLAESANLLANPGFESGTSPWVFHTNGTGTYQNNAAGSGSARAAHITITTEGTNVQLYQAGIVLAANTQYSLSFKAYSNTGHDLSVSLIKNVSPYTNYGLRKVFNLTSSWNSYSVTFTTGGFTGAVSDGQLMFWLAPYDAAGDQYFIDDVVLTKATAAATGPSISTHPLDQTAEEGQQAAFSVVATGSAPLFYQWQRNSAEIPGATTATYTIPAVDPGDSGSTYRCVVTNAAGSATSNAATLTVTPATIVNLILNPGFETGKPPWFFFTDGSGDFSVINTGSNNVGRVWITTAGTNVQLSQAGLMLEPATRYRLLFRAYSNSGHDVRVSLLKNKTPYTNYGLNNVFDLTTVCQTYTVEFSTSGFAGTTNDGRLMFWLAPYDADGDLYFFDSVVLEKVLQQ